MIPRLPDAFLKAPLAHRALHDVTDGRPENSRAAIRAAIAHGYGIEIDVQLNADDQAMVFHDYALDRLAEGSGPVRAVPAGTLARTSLIGGDEGIGMPAPAPRWRGAGGPTIPLRRTGSSRRWKTATRSGRARGGSRNTRRRR